MGKKAYEPTSKDRRRFAFDKANELWMSDVMHGPSVFADGKRKRKTYLIATLDDATRVVPYAAFAMHENTAAFLPVLQTAILRRGIPKRLYVDNGSAYRSQHLALVCAKLGITLIHARPYQPQGKGKQERWFRTVRMQLLPMLTQDDFKSLEALNSRLWSWVEAEYHMSPHKGLDGITPFDRWATAADDVTLPGPERDLDELFLFELNRKVQSDRTISLHGAVYELDACLVGMLFFTLNREDFSFVIHLDRQPRTSRRREAQTGSRARSGSRSERTLDAVEHSRTLMEWWPFLIFHRGGLRIKVINNTRPSPCVSTPPAAASPSTSTSRDANTKKLKPWTPTPTASFAGTTPPSTFIPTHRLSRRRQDYPCAISKIGRIVNMYRKHFGLTQHPFSNEIEPEELFLATSYKELEVRLAHLIDMRGIGLVTGDSGSGKTCCCRKVLHALHASLYRVLYVCLSTGNVMDLYKTISWEMGLPVERSRAALFRQIRAEVTRLVSEARCRPILVIDEAHHLRPEVLEELRLLTNYNMDAENRLCLLLLGQSELRRRLSMAVHEALSQRIVVRYHLSPLTREELPAYLTHRLRCAGTELPIFEPPAQEALFQASGGLPRKVNLLAHHALLAAALARTKSVSAEHVELALPEVA